MRFLVILGLFALFSCARAFPEEDTLASMMAQEMKKHEHVGKNKTITQLAHEIVQEARAMGHEILTYAKKTVAAAPTKSSAGGNETSFEDHHAHAAPSRHARMLDDLVNFFVPSESDLAEAAGPSISNHREQRADNSTETTTAAATTQTKEKAEVKSYGVNYRPPPPSYNQPPQQQPYGQQPQMGYNNGYQPQNGYPTAPAYTTAQYTTPYTYTTPYYTTTTTTTTTTAKPKPILVPIPGPPGPPGPPGLMGLPGLPGKTPNLVGLKAILLAKLAKLTLLIKAVAVICLIKFVGLLGLFFGLILPLAGKLKTAGVVLPLAVEPEEPAYEPLPQGSYAAAAPAAAPSGYDRSGPAGTFAPLSQPAVDELTGTVLPSIEDAQVQYSSPRPSSKPVVVKRVNKHVVRRPPVNNVNNKVNS